MRGGKNPVGVFVASISVWYHPVWMLKYDPSACFYVSENETILAKGFEHFQQHINDATLNRPRPYIHAVLPHLKHHVQSNGVIFGV